MHSYGDQLVVLVKYIENRQSNGGKSWRVRDKNLRFLLIELPISKKYNFLPPAILTPRLVYTTTRTLSVPSTKTSLRHSHVFSNTSITLNIIYANSNSDNFWRYASTTVNMPKNSTYWADLLRNLAFPNTRKLFFIASEVAHMFQSIISKLASKLYWPGSFGISTGYALEISSFQRSTLRKVI